MAFEGGSFVLITAGQLNEAAGPITNDTRIKGDAGLTYQFSGVSGEATLEQMPAEGADYVVISGISSDFVGVATGTTPATAPVLGALSQAAGTLTDGTIPDITVVGKYVVKHRGKWYAISGSTPTFTLAAAPSATVAAAVEATVATTANTDDLTGLANDEVYNLYIAYTLAASGTIAATGANLNTAGKNAIADIRGLADGEQVTAAAGFLTTGSRVIVLTGEALPAADPVTTFSAAMVYATGGTHNFNGGSYGSYAVGTGTVIEAVTEGDTWFTLTGGSGGGSLVIAIKKTANPV
jgi:hypothetical protein